jgi:hypothetical protein
MYIDIDEKIKKIAHRYGLTIEKSRRRYALTDRMPLSYYHASQDYSDVYQQPIEREPLNKIYLTRAACDRLMMDLSTLDVIGNELDYLRKIEHRYFKEQSLRESNPALKRAWENYQTILNLVK